MQKNQSKSYFAFMVYVGVFLLTFFIGNVHEITLEIPLYNATTSVALDYDDVDEDTPMGYVLLSKMPNAEKLLQAYDAIDLCMSKRQESVSLSTLGLTVTEFENVIDACISDHPEYFWIDSTSYSYTYIPGVLVIEEAFPEYIMSSSEIATAKPLVDEEVEKILDNITSDMTDYDKEKYIHDALAKSIDYVESEDDGTIYGALVLDECVCEGYARTFQYLLNLAGVEAYYVTGASADPSSDQVVGHAWNLVEIDNEYYFVDLTWADQGDSPAEIFYPYFNVTERQMSEDHILSPVTEDGKAYYAYLPDATATAANYFIKNDRVIDPESLTVAKVAGLISNPIDGAARALHQGDQEALYAWWNENYLAVAAELGINGSFSYGMWSVGDEVQFVLVAYGEIVLETPGPITIESGDEYALVATVTPKDLTMVWSSGNKNIATVDSTGKVTAVSPGTATITVSTEDYQNQVVVHVKERKPNARVADGYVTNLVANAVYEISCSTQAATEYTADRNGKISVVDAWQGETIAIVKVNDDATYNSSAQELDIPMPKEAAEILVVQGSDGNWYSCQNGEKVNYTGFADNDYGTWYVENGRVTFAKNDVIYDNREGEGNWKYVVESKFAVKNTVAQNSNGWWRIENGIVNFGATGVYQNELGWWYCKGGKVQFGYTGIQSNANGWWRIEGGKVNFSATGVYQNELGWWYCLNGKVQFNYTGIKNNANGWWRIENGKVNFSANGVYQNENGWWKVENGKVNFSFTGIASNSNGRWYCVNGKVDFSKNGSVYYGGRYYTVRGGKIV